MLFLPLTFFLAALLLFLGYSFAFQPDKMAVLPRLRWAGVVLGIPCLAWSAWHGCIMLEGGLAKFHTFVWCLVPILTILCALYLDYLFARALGGFLILSSNELIRCAFIYDVPLRGVYSVVCLLLGICGLFLLGAPWHLRDALKLANEKPPVGRTIAASLVAVAFLLIILSCLKRLS